MAASEITHVVSTVVTILATIVTAIASYYAIRLHQARIQFEEQTKDIREHQQQILQQTSEFSTQLVNQTLRLTPQLAFSPYPQVLPSLSPSDVSLFDRRRSHFTPEKEKLAEAIVERIRVAIDREAGGDEDLTIILVLDAGSTALC